MRIATIAIQPDMDSALNQAGDRFARAFENDEYQGE